MRNRTTKLSIASSHRGFTLVEVVAGMALLAILLVGIVQATTAHKRSLLRSADRLEAAALADELLASLPGRDGRYVVQTGTVVDRPAWVWSISRTGSQILEGFVVETLRFQIIDTSTRRSTPLITVDLAQGRGTGRP